jgi:hypothetical protein
MQQKKNGRMLLLPLWMLIVMMFTLFYLKYADDQAWDVMIEYLLGTVKWPLGEDPGRYADWAGMLILSTYKQAS